MDQLRFDGKVAIVTGGGRGMGRAHALSLAARGAKVVIADRGVALDGSGWERGPADEVVAEIKAAGGDAVASYGSVADEADVKAMVELTLDTYGRLDILINNAGINGPDLFEDYTGADFRRLNEVLYLGTVYPTQAAWPHLKKSGRGRIVNTCSEGPLGIHEMMTAYGGGKGGVIGFTLALAAEASKYGIGVNGFSPRPATRMSSPEVLSHVYGKPVEAFAKNVSKLTPELASTAAIYLVHESCELNGVMLVCGGGQVLRMAIMQNQGFTDPQMTVESIASHIDQIVDMSHATNVGVGAGGKASMPHTKAVEGAH